MRAAGAAQPVAPALGSELADSDPPGAAMVRGARRSVMSSSDTDDRIRTLRLTPLGPAHPRAARPRGLVLAAVVRTAVIGPARMPLPSVKGRRWAQRRSAAKSRSREASALHPGGLRASKAAAGADRGVHTTRVSAATDPTDKDARGRPRAARMTRTVVVESRAPAPSPRLAKWTIEPALSSTPGSPKKRAL